MLIKDRTLPSGFTHHNPFNRDSMIYLTKGNIGWSENELKNIFDLPVEVDCDSLLNNIIFGRNEKKTSLVHGVECIAPGWGYTVGGSLQDSHVNELFDWEYITQGNVNDDPAGILNDIISDSVSVFKNGVFVIRLSGGLDSTGILLALMESVEVSRIIAVTYSYRMGSSNEDEFITRELCRKYNIKLIILEFEPNNIFQKIEHPVPPVLNMRVINYKIHENEKELIRQICGDDFLIFDGHGGDHVFGEKIPPMLPAELFYRGKLFKSAKVLSNMARLYGLSLKDIALMQKNTLMGVLDEARRFFNEDALLNLNIRNKCVAEDRKSLLLDAIQDNKLVKTSGNNKYEIFPFTDVRMIRYGLNLDIVSSFNAHHKRIQYRNAIRDRYGFTFTRRDKGHITGVYQSAISINKSRLTHLVKNGRLSKAGLIKVASVCEAMEIAARGIGGVSHILVKIIAAELIFEAYNK